MRKPFALLLLMLPALAGLAGCARGGKAAGEDPAAPPDPLTVTVKLDKANYRPGEAVLATVEAVNNASSPFTLSKLNAAHLAFVFGRQGDPERVERRAVVSELENLDERQTLAPGQAERRTFVLTRVTEFAGPLALQVHYTPGNVASGGSGLPSMIYSNTVTFTVKGERLFKRDPEGFITKEEAIRVARATARSGAGEAEAIFVRDEAGFHKWWVNLKPGGAAAATGWLIDPYLGTPWHQAKPFDPRMARDPRFDRPPGLPRTRIPAQVPR